MPKPAVFNADKDAGTPAEPAISEAIANFFMENPFVTNFSRSEDRNRKHYISAVSEFAKKLAVLRSYRAKQLLPGRDRRRGGS
ncbi:MAG: hypothetical protein ACLRWH_03895 [Emergencia sp.]